MLARIVAAEERLFDEAAIDPDDGLAVEGEVVRLGLANAHGACPFAPIA